MPDLTLALQGGHGDPVATLVLWLAVALAVAKAGGEVAVRLGQPAVLGELLAGVLIGNLELAGITTFVHLKEDPSLDMLARVGVLVLLFEVGVEATVRQLLGVGLSALLVALAGVAAPFALGWLAASWLLPEMGGLGHAFLGAALSATSIGVTARVLVDLQRQRTPEARIILGAAVLDDVLALVVLAVVTGIIQAEAGGRSASAGDAGLVVVKALGFLLAAVLLGVWLSPGLFRLAARLRAHGMLLTTGLVLCFVTAWLADQAGLAPIVGAFAAGLVLEDAHSRLFVERGERSLDELLRPIAELLVPLFFVLMGMRTDLRAFADPAGLGLAVAFTVAAVLGKLACGLVVVRKGTDRLTVGVGMIPRGEVGLIFANLGLGLTIAGKPIVDGTIYSALVVMVILTTLATPLLLRWSLRRQPAAPE